MQFLGTAAAECYPNPFCECPSCRKARASADRRCKRRRSSLLFDEETLIDFNADMMYACAEFGVSLSRLKRVFLTHMHEDHFDYFNTAFMNMSVTPAGPITFYASPAACSGFQSILDAVRALPHPLLNDQLREMAQVARFVALEVGQTVEFPDLRVTPVAARHDGFFLDEYGYNYLLEKPDHTTFYASDTGRLPEESLHFLEKHPVDTLIIEGSFGRTTLPEGAGHLDCLSLCETIDRLYQQGTLHPQSRIYVTHIGHKGIYNLDDYQQFLDSRYQGRVQVAWDGLVI